MTFRKDVDLSIVPSDVEPFNLSYKNIFSAKHVEPFVSDSLAWDRRDFYAPATHWIIRDLETTENFEATERDVALEITLCILGKKDIVRTMPIAELQKNISKDKLKKVVQIWAWQTKEEAAIQKARYARKPIAIPKTIPEHVRRVNVDKMYFGVSICVLGLGENAGDFATKMLRWEQKIDGPAWPNCDVKATNWAICSSQLNGDVSPTPINWQGNDQAVAMDKILQLLRYSCGIKKETTKADMTKRMALAWIDSWNDLFCVYAWT